MSLLTIKALLRLVDSSAFIKTWVNFEEKKKESAEFPAKLKVLVSKLL